MKYQDGHLHLTYRGNPCCLSSTGSLTYDLGDENPKTQEGVVLFSNSQDLASKYVDGIVHINVTTEGARKISKEDVNAHVLGVIMAQQFSLHSGLKKFGDKAKKSVTKELTQIHDMGTYTPIDPYKMTKDQKRLATRSLMLITEKRDGRIKAQGVADGRSKRRRPVYKTEDFSSPTVLHHDYIDAHNLTS